MQNNERVLLKIHCLSLYFFLSFWTPINHTYPLCSSFFSVEDLRKLIEKSGGKFESKIYSQSVTFVASMAQVRRSFSRLPCNNHHRSRGSDNSISGCPWISDGDAGNLSLNIRFQCFHSLTHLNQDDWWRRQKQWLCLSQLHTWSTPYTQFRGVANCRRGPAHLCWQCRGRSYPRDSAFGRDHLAMLHCTRGHITPTEWELRQTKRYIIK